MNMKSLFTGLAVFAALLAVPCAANAQSVSLRLEPGVAIPTTDPQANRFGVGGFMAVKPEIGLGSYFSLGPVVSFMALPSNVPGVETGTAWTYGGFARLKRPHDEKNTDTGLAAVSPWVDANAGFVRTDPLDRFGWGVAVGAQVPTSDSRVLWVGPYVGFQAVHQEDDKVSANTNSAKTVVAGLSFEFGCAAKKKAVAALPPPPPPPVQPPAETPPPPVKEVPPPAVVVHFKPKVQFAWDSANLEPVQVAVLGDVVKSMLADKSYHVRVEGHASSEGTVAHNNALSERRAQAVRDFLISNGVASDRLTMVGFGSRVPVANNSTEAGRVANRRVEFDVTFTLVKGNK